MSTKYFCIFFGGLECAGHFFAYAPIFVFLGDVWIRTQRAAAASMCATNLTTHLLHLMAKRCRESDIYSLLAMIFS
jgi:hypothetical protein